MLNYTCVQEGFTLTELKNNEDFEFTIVIKDVDKYLPAMKRIREHFDQDTLYTDVLFYIHHNNEYQIIVRQDHYLDFDHYKAAQF